MKRLLILAFLLALSVGCTASQREAVKFPALYRPGEKLLLTYSNWPFAGFHAARVAAEKSVARVPAIRRDPLRRGPEAKMVCFTASSLTAANFAANGRADNRGRNRRVHTSTHAIIASARAA